MNKTITISYFKTIYGELILWSFNGKICLCDWRYRRMRQSIDKRITQWLNASYKEWMTSVIALLKKELEEYFNQKRTFFTMELLLIWTDFQKSIWKELIRIPYGITSTYLKLANSIGNPLSVRAVWTANGANAISILIPCHRIIGTDGNLVWYAGGLRVKKKLLESEGIQVDNQTVLF